MTLRFSRGLNIRDNQPRQIRVSDFAQFVDYLARERAPKKIGAGYICGPLNDDGQQNGDGRRCAEGALSRRFLAVDLDRIEASLLPAVRMRLACYRGCGWSTHSSTPDAPRERAILELSRDATRLECIAVGATLANDLHDEFGDGVVVDPSTFRGEQPVFLPPPGYELAQYPGVPLDVDKFLAAAPGQHGAQTKDMGQRTGGGAGATVQALRAGAGLHDTMARLVARWAAKGMDAHEIRTAALQALEEARPARGARVDEFGGAELQRLIDGAIRKYAPAERPSTDGEPADFNAPLAAARSFVQRAYTDAESGALTLRYWQGELHAFAGTHWDLQPLVDVRAAAYEFGEQTSIKPVKKRAVDDFIDALKAAVNLSRRDVPCSPAWIDRRADDPDPRDLLPVANGLLRIDCGVLLPATPRLFVQYVLPFPFAVAAPPPSTWRAFLAELWPEDAASIDALQEWLGYLLTADTSLQKGLMLVGPRRSGKGTIGRVIVQLLGEGNVASPTLASLGNPFGLEPLVGKLAALMSDARLGGRADIAAISENLLRIIGEDSIGVDRKFREAYTARLPTRVVILSNELPVFRDAAAALPSRFILLRTTESFLGREDHGLEGKLRAELPGILNWALEGLRRLRARGRFLQPASAVAQMRIMEDLASPITAFLRDECVQEPGAQVPVAKLYEAWRDWCKEHGREKPGTEQTFGRDIAAAVPGAGHSRPRINGQRVRMYLGIRIRTPDDTPAGDEGEE